MGQHLECADVAAPGLQKVLWELVESGLAYVHPRRYFCSGTQHSMLIRGPQRIDPLADQRESLQAEASNATAPELKEAGAELCM